uniref:SUN domain-containing protein n=1 Tax=Cyclopterus lumpus TaxID=8103 RepID=A0A8C2XHK9_CYCLU
FSQDRTGLADFALESGGQKQNQVLMFWGVGLRSLSLTCPDVHPGSCWAFKGSAGVLVLRLSRRILPTSFSLEHLPKALAPSGGRLSSAPRDFSVYVSQRDHGRFLLGSFTYDEAGEALQTFRVLVILVCLFINVLSNWGHQDYTCLYRFRAHGTLYVFRRKHILVTTL